MADQAHQPGGADDETDSQESALVINAPSREEKAQKASVGQTFTNLVKSMVGAGFLATPYASKNVGYLGTMIIVPMVMLGMELGVRLLISTKRELKMRGYRDQELTYVGLGRILLGQLGFSVVLTTLAVAQLGVCIAYYIFVAEVCHQFYSGFAKWAYIFMMMGLEGLLCQIRHIRQLQYTSLVGNVMVAAVVVSIYVFNIIKLGDSGNQAHKAWDLNIRDFPRSVGIFTFALEGITVVLPLESAMREPKYFMTVMDAVLIGMSILLFTFGEVGYMVNGEATKDMVTKNLPATTFVDCIMVTIMLNLLCTFPVQMFPVTEILDRELLTKEHSQNEATRSLLRLGCVVFCGLFAIMLPHFGAVIGVMGGICFCTLGMIFPVLFYLILFEESLSPHKFWGLIFVAVFGSAVSMLVTINSTIDLLNGD